MFLVEMGEVCLSLKHGCYALLEPPITFIMSQYARLTLEKFSTNILINSTTTMMAIEVT
jgi:hypothetical protein